MDTMEQVAELERLRGEAFDALQRAKADSDLAAIAKAKALLIQIDDAIDDAVMGIFKGLATNLADIRNQLEAATKNAKDWPFGDHETQFRDELQDNDFEDKGPVADPPPPAPVASDIVPTVTKGWSDNYEKLWETMTIRPEWRGQAEAIAKRIIQAQGKYAAAVAGTVVPWWFLAVVHSMECGLDFSTHPHNGDKLTARTVRVPKGRPPVVDHFPIDWVDSARDAIVYERLDKVTDWSLPSVLYHWHRYNGINNKYKTLQIPTPYLWSGSQHYIKGKYVADHEFDVNAVSKQVGAAVILKTLIELGAVILGDKQARGDKQALVANPVAATQSIASLALVVSGEGFKHIEAELAFPGALGIGSPKGKGVRRLQEWLNLHGFPTSIDSEFGQSTAEQLGKLAAKHGRPAPANLDEELWAVLTAPLRKALAPISGAASLEEAVVKVAAQHIAQQPAEVGGNNRGPWVRTYMGGEDGVEKKWCAGFACLVIRQAARDMGTDMPFERQVGVDELVADAKKDKRFISEGEVTTPLLRQSKIRPGYLFVVRKTATDWVHTGIVLNVMPETFDTLEGNTGGDAGVDGPNARRGNRSYPKKDFIRIL